MKVKDLFAICGNDKLLACITAYYRNASGYMVDIEEMTALPLIS